MAQVAHAVSLVSLTRDLQTYHTASQKTIIVLEGSAAQIENLYRYLKERGIRSDFVIDEGVNEIPTMSTTALATEQLDIDEVDRDMFKGFKLYKHGRFQR